MIQEKRCPKCDYANDVLAPNCNKCFVSLATVTHSTQKVTETQNSPEQDIASGSFFCCGQEHSVSDECFLCGNGPENLQRSSDKPEITPPQNQKTPTVELLELVLNSGQKIPVNSGLLLGRSSVCICQELRDEAQDRLGVSRMHAWVGLVEGGYFLMDLSSTNGTFANGEQLKPNVAQSIRVGSAPLSISLGKYFHLTLQQREH